MPHSPYEIEILENLERDLRADDPIPVTAPSASPPAEGRQRVEPTSETTRADQDEQDPWGTAKPALTTLGALRVALAVILIVAAVLPPTWSVVVPLLLTLVLLPWLPRLTQRAVEWVQRQVG